MDTAQDIPAASTASESGVYFDHGQINDAISGVSLSLTSKSSFLGAIQRDSEDNRKDSASISDAPTLTTADPNLTESWNKYWATVKSTPTDFDTWEELLRLIDTQDGGYGPEAPATNVATMRTVYNAFLGQFPLCFGYWKKYSDLEFLSSGVQGAIEVSLTPRALRPFGQVDCILIYLPVQ